MVKVLVVLVMLFQDAQQLRLAQEMFLLEVE
jgi:hypothetical protein